jgi:hypothetical protein
MEFEVFSGCRSRHREPPGIFSVLTLETAKSYIEAIGIERGVCPTMEPDCLQIVADFGPTTLGPNENDLEHAKVSRGA